MLLLNALRLLLSMKVSTGSAMHTVPLLESKARPSLFTACAAASATRAAFAATGVIRCTILDSPDGRRFGILKITGILTVPVMTDGLSNNPGDVLRSTGGLLNRLSNVPHCSLNGSVKRRRAALGNNLGAKLKLALNRIGVNQVMLFKAPLENRIKPQQIVGHRVCSTRLDGNDGTPLQRRSRGIELSSVVEAKATKHSIHKGHKVLRGSEPGQHLRPSCVQHVPKRLPQPDINAPQRRQPEAITSTNGRHKLRVSRPDQVEMAVKITRTRIVELVAAADRVGGASQELGGLTPGTG
jgi:hypothetical protein